LLRWVACCAPRKLAGRIQGTWQHHTRRARLPQKTALPSGPCDILQLAKRAAILPRAGMSGKGVLCARGPRVTASQPADAPFELRTVSSSVSTWLMVVKPGSNWAGPRRDPSEATSPIRLQGTVSWCIPVLRIPPGSWAPYCSLMCRAYRCYSRVMPKTLTGYFNVGRSPKTSCRTLARRLRQLNSILGTPLATAFCIDGILPDVQFIKTAPHLLDKWHASFSRSTPATCLVNPMGSIWTAPFCCQPALANVLLTLARDRLAQ